MAVVAVQTPYLLFVEAPGSLVVAVAGMPVAVDTAVPSWAASP